MPALIIFIEIERIEVR